MADLEGLHRALRLNSRLVKQNGKLVEEVYKVGRPLRPADPRRRSATSRTAASLRHAHDEGGPGPAGAVVSHRRATADRTGLSTSPGWPTRTSPVDTINGFIEVYMDPRGVKGSWEAAGLLRQPAEDRGDPRSWPPTRSGSRTTCRLTSEFRKPDVKGITAKAIDVVIETGESGPITPIGINLPNDQKVREQHGSKSVSLSNVDRGLRPLDDSGVPQGVRLGRPRKSRAPASGAPSPANCRPTCTR